MFKHTLRELRDKRFWLLLSLSLVVLFCLYWFTLPSPIFIKLGAEDDERYIHNFYLREQGELYPFRWTKDSSSIRIPDLGSLPLEITLAADAARPEGQPLPRVALIANGTILADFTMQNGIRAYQFLYHPPLFPLPKELLLEAKSDTFVPPGDNRALGILLNTVEVKPIISPLRLLQVPLMGALSIAFSYLLLRWWGVSPKKSLVCGMVALVLLSLDILRWFTIAGYLIGVFSLLLVGYVLAMLLEARGYRDLVVTQLERKPLRTWAGDLVYAIWSSIKNQALSSPSQDSRRLDVLAAYLPAVVLFILMPFALYLPNQSVFDHDLTYVIPYLVLAVMCFVFLIGLLFSAGQFMRNMITMLLFYVGIYLCLSDILCPVQLEALMGGRETPTEPFFLTAVEVALVIITIFSAIRLPWKWVKRFGSIFVLLLVISEAVVVLNGLSPETGLRFVKSAKNIAPPPGKLAGGGNTYHITLDSYSSGIFLGSLEEMKLLEEFDGFTFFKENHANYVYTQESVPSYMTGSFYEEGNSLEEWKERYKSSGLISNVYDAGYEVSMYVPDSGYITEKASYIKAFKDMWGQRKRLSSYCHFADLWLLRAVPNFLQQEVYREGKGVFTRLFVEEAMAGNNAKIFSSVGLMQQLISDEANRPDHGQYVYVHLPIPHRPYVMDRNCVFSTDSTYDEQALCATRLMAEFISKLKELGRYHGATIIIQADHAMEETACSKSVSDRIMSLEVKKKIEAVNFWKSSAEAIQNRVCALLLVKPPLQSGKPLVISDRPTQLADIPATIYDLLDLPVRAKEGESVFLPDFPETREIHIFVGLLIQKNDKGQKYGFGAELFEGEANHFSFTNGIGWKVYPNIHVRWE